MKNYVLLSHNISSTSQAIYGFKGTLSSIVYRQDISAVHFEANALAKFYFSYNITYPGDSVTFQITYSDYTLWDGWTPYQQNNNLPTPASFWLDFSAFGKSLGSITVKEQYIKAIYSTYNNGYQDITYISDYKIIDGSTNTYDIYSNQVRFQYIMFPPDASNNNPFGNACGNFSTIGENFYLINSIRSIDIIVKVNHFWELYDGFKFVKKGLMPKNNEFFDTPYNPSKVKLDTCTVFIGGAYSTLQTAEIEVDQKMQLSDGDITENEYYDICGGNSCGGSADAQVVYQGHIIYGSTPYQTNNSFYWKYARPTPVFGVVKIYPATYDNDTKGWSDATYRCSGDTDWNDPGMPPFTPNPACETPIRGYTTAKGWFVAVSGISAPLYKINTSSNYTYIPYKTETISNSIHLFDETTLEMRSIGNLPVGLYGSTCIQIDLNTFLIFGGATTCPRTWMNAPISNKIYKVVVSDDKKSCSISSIGNTKFGHLHASCVKLEGINKPGLIAICGGENYEIYDIINNKTVIYGPLSKGARYGANLSVYIHDGIVDLYIAGGYNRVIQEIPRIDNVSVEISYSGTEPIPDIDSRIKGRVLYAGPILTSGFNNGVADPTKVDYMGSLIKSNLRELFITYADDSSYSYPIYVNIASSMNYDLTDPNCVFYQFKFKTPAIIQGIRFRLKYYSASISQFGIYGSSDGLLWNLIETINISLVDSGMLDNMPIFITNTVKYLYFKLVISKTYYDQTGIQLVHIDIFTDLDVNIPLRNVLPEIPAKYGRDNYNRPVIYGGITPVYFPYKLYDVDTTPGSSPFWIDPVVVLNPGVEVVTLPLTISDDLIFNYTPMLNTTGIFTLTFSDFVKNKLSYIYVNGKSDHALLILSNTLTIDIPSQFPGLTLTSFKLVVNDNSTIMTQTIQASIIDFSIDTSNPIYYGDTINVYICMPVGATAILMPENVPIVNGYNKITATMSGNWYAIVTLGTDTIDTNVIPITLNLKATFTASSNTFINPGDPIVLTAKFNFGTGVITPGDIPILNNGSVTVNPTVSTTYTLTVTYNGIINTFNLTINPIGTATSIIYGQNVIDKVVSTDPPCPVVLGNHYKLYQFNGTVHDDITIYVQSGWGGEEGGLE
jgi:hypothetical protein